MKFEEDEKFDVDRLNILVECIENDDPYEWWSSMPIRAFARTVLDSLNSSIMNSEVNLNDFHDRVVNRCDVKKFVKRSDVSSMAKVLFVLGWGGMRTPHAANALSSFHEHWKDIVDSMLDGKINRFRAYDKFHSLNHGDNARKKGKKVLEGMGPAYYTKLIFFLQKKHNGYIMDQWTSRSMNLLRKDASRNIHLKRVYKKGEEEEDRKNYYVDSEKNDVSVYRKFCKDLEDLSDRLAHCFPETITGNKKQKAEATEQLIFSRGNIVRVPLGNWRDYVLENTSDKSKPKEIKIKNRRSSKTIS